MTHTIVRRAINPYPDLWSTNDAWSVAEGLIEVADVSPAHSRVLEEMSDVRPVSVTLTKPMALEGARAIPEGTVIAVDAETFRRISANSRYGATRILVGAHEIEESQPWNDDAAGSGLWVTWRVALVLEDESLVFAGACDYRTTDAIERFLGVA